MEGKARRRGHAERAFACARLVHFAEAELENLRTSSSQSASFDLPVQCMHKVPEISAALAAADAPERGAADDDQALKWKQKGDELYGQWQAAERQSRGSPGPHARLLGQALRAYTEALCCGGARTKLGGLAYANRAAVLYQMERFDAAAEDCDRAQQAGYPADKLFKLLQRRGNCRLRLGQPSLAWVDLQQALALLNERAGQEASLAPVKAQITKEVDQARRAIAGEKKGQRKKGETRGAATAQPSPSMDNPRIAHASSAVAIRRSPEAGRFVVAAEDIKLGEPVTREEAYAAVLLRPYELTHCHHCFTQEAVLIPCCRCSWARFCSERCREAAAWYHVYECGEAFFEAAPTLLVLCLRILLRRQAREGAAQGLDGRAPTTGQPLRGLVPRGDDEWRADYGDICSLLPHVEDLPKETIEEYLRYCIVARAYVEHRANRAREEEEQRRQIGGGGENDVQSKNESEDDDDVRMGKWMDIRLLFRHLCQTHTNVYAIYEVADDDEHGGVVQRRVAEAMYATGSLFNHSCRPNTVLNYEGRVLTIRACEDIAKGKEVLNCYGPHVAHIPSRDERQKALRHQYFFTCRCDACSSVEQGGQDFDYLVCGSEGCTRELQINPEQLRQGNFVIVCGCGEEVDIRVVQREIKLAREFYERARRALDGGGGDGSGDGDVERAAQSLAHALRLRAKYLHPQHRELGRTHDALAEAHARLGRYEAAATHLERAVAVLESRFAPFSFELADQYAKLAQAWFNARRDPRRTLAWIDKAERVWTVLTGGGGDDGRPCGGSLVKRGGQRVLDELHQMRVELRPINNK